MRTRALSEAATATRRRVGVRAALLIPGLLLFVPARANPAEAHMQITSSSFTHQGTIPAKYTCEGRTPRRRWPGAASLLGEEPGPHRRRSRRARPEGAQDDLGALGPLRHPGRELLAGRGCRASLPAGTEERAERLEEDRVRRALPAHRPAPVLLQALRARHGPSQLGKPSKADLLKAMEGHVVASAELVGTYQKAQK